MHISYVRSENGKIKMKKHKQLTFLNFYLQVMRTLKRALQPVMSDVNVAWDLAKGWTVHQIPSSLPPLFSGDRLVVYGVLKASENANEGDDNEVRLEGMLGNDEKVKHVVKFSTPPIAVGHKGNVPLHQLAAKSFMQEKQDGYSERNNVQETEEAKRSSISISKSANVVSKFTSFVAVDKDSNQPVSGPLQKHLVPSRYDAVACSMPMPTQTISFTSYDLCEAGAVGAKKTGGVGFGFGVKSEKKSLKKKSKSKGFFPLLFGSAAPPPPPPAARKSAMPFCPPGPDSMSQKTKDSPGALSVAENKELVDLEVPQKLCAAVPHPSAPPQAQKQKNSLTVLALTTFQKASGSWDLTDKLVSLCGTSRDAWINGCPKEIAVDTGEGKLLWTTALVLVVLMGRFLDQKDEWEMIAEKGSKWMKKNLPAGVKYEIVLEAAATAVSVKIY